MKTLGRVRLEIRPPGIDEASMEEFIVVEDTLLRPAILGIGWWRRQQVNWTGGEDKAYVGGANGKPFRIIVGGRHEGLTRRAPTSSHIAEDSRPIQDLLEKYKECFASDDAQYGLFKGDPIRIILKDANTRPIRRAPYRMSPREASEVDQYVAELEAADVVSEAADDVEWAFPARLVEKQDDPAKKKRFVVDMHQLTDLIHVGAYPAPDMEMLLSKLHGSKFFSKLDLQGAFYQFLVAKECRNLLGFVTPSGRHFVLNRIPMGLACSSALLQRRLDGVFKGIPNMYGYADDWWIASPTYGEHVSSLEAALRRLRDSGLLLKRSKCVFAAKEIKLLGRVVSAEGIRPDPEETAAIFKMKRPTCCDEVRTFLGRTVWVSKFVRKYATTVAPLRPMLRLGARFEWTPRCEGAWEALKTILTSAPVLAHPDWNSPFVIEVDASRDGLGAVLMQNEKPIAYKSRALTPAERDLPITFLELLGVTWIVDEWSHYLRQRKFTIRTDHRSLQWIRNLRRPVGRLAQWANTLSDYDFDVKFVPGAQMGIADALSRLVAAVSPSASASSLDSEITAERVATEQHDDPDCIHILRALATETEQDPGDGYSEDFLLNDEGLLCRVSSKYNLPYLMVVVPKSLREEVLRREHDQAAHPARERTIARIRTKYWWQSLDTQVREWVMSCERCQRRRGTRARQHTGGSLATTGFGDIVAVDLLSGLRPGPNGEISIMVITDHFSKLTTAVALHDKTSKSCADAFEAHWLSKHGAPKSILSDQGPEFTGAPFIALCKMHNINKKFTTAYHPQGDGVTERFNQTLLARLARTVKTQQDWPQLLQEICEQYNDEVHATTKATPNLLAGCPSKSDEHLRSLGAGLLASKKKIHEAKRDAILEAQQRAADTQQRAKTNAKKSSRQYIKYLLKGKKVMVRNLTDAKKPAGKLEDKWIGPYTILSRPHEWTVLVIPSRGGNAKTVNIANVKPYIERKKPENAEGRPRHSLPSRERSGTNNTHTLQSSANGEISFSHTPANHVQAAPPTITEIPQQAQQSVEQASEKDVSLQNHHQHDADTDIPQQMNSQTSPDIPQQTQQASEQVSQHDVSLENPQQHEADTHSAQPTNSTPLNTEVAERSTMITNTATRRNVRRLDYARMARGDPQ